MIVSCDASGLEWRTALFLSQDKVGIQELHDGVDTHDDNRRRYKLGEGKAARTTAKIFLFKLIYGASAYSYANDPDFTHISTKEKFWQGIIDKTYEKYPQLGAWHVKLVQEAIETGKVVIPSGREFVFHDAANPRERPKILNYPCQGFGADIVMVARISAYRRIKKISDEIKFVNTVHDSKVNDCPAKYLDIVAQTYYSCYTDLPTNLSRMFNIDFNVPLDCEVTYGPNLGDEVTWDKELRPVLKGDKNQCPSCGELFNSTYAFDTHRHGSFGKDRRCMTLEEMTEKGMAKNDAGFWISSKNPLY